MELAKILIVEDESIVALDIQFRLENIGYQILDSVKTGEDAIEAAGKLSPDLILMDIHLQGKMDGIEAAQIIRSRYKLPVIFLTAFVDGETLQRAGAAQAFGYILKPFDTHSLSPTIELALHKHKIEQSLRESEARYRGLVETIPDAVLMTDLDFHILFCNHQALLMYRFEDQALLLGQNALNLIVPECLPELTRHAQDLLETAESGTIESEMRRKNGDVFPGEIKAALLFDADAHPQGYIAIVRDISDRRQLEQQARDLLGQVQNLARRDSLTNLYNHRYFYEMAEAEFVRTKRYGHALAAMMVDLDHFKAVNDTYGHLAGDQVLRSVAEYIQSNLRAIDIVGRIGGEEFLALLPETTLTEAVTIAERLCQSIAQTLLTIGSVTIHVTASLGIAVLDQDGASLEVLLDRADQAMYYAKQNGRSRVEVWRPTYPGRDVPGSFPNKGMII